MTKLKAILLVIGLWGGAMLSSFRLTESNYRIIAKAQAANLVESTVSRDKIQVGDYLFTGADESAKEDVFEEVTEFVTLLNTQTKAKDKQYIKGARLGNARIGIPRPPL